MLPPSTEKLPPEPKPRTVAGKVKSKPLTQAEIEKAKPGDNSDRLWDTGGLYLESRPIRG